ncbi:hypothetical protein FLP30_13385 (plasmid) [Acetobacter vaccinii]|uniref:Septal ring lytic transglycosylase RlpA family lipoprotein n=1 Tax=Acetobacter vaccinii TaxID=2592655 RepID=A0A5C1YR80_9PROT|nr:hypothetical protein FLP30_13385 [Acetobacter vaccinii]
MRRIILLSAFCLAGCAQGNLQSTAARPLTPPAVQQAYYSPYAAYGSAPAIWQPPVANRAGSIVKPSDPADQAGRPDYENAPWSVAKLAAKAGTF